MEATQRALVHVWRRLAPAAIVSVFYYGVLVYPVLRISTLTFPGWQPDTLALLLIMVGPLAGRLAYEFAPNPLTRWLSAVALTWLGVCFIAFTLVVAWELANVPLDLPARESGLTLLAATAALSVGGFVNAQLVTVRTLDVEVPREHAAALTGTRIAQISDVHVGSRRGGLLTRAVRAVNGLEPHYVFITGDLVDFRDVPERELAALATLTAPAYFVIGNHERYVDLEAICARLEKLGVIVLRNRAVDAGPIQIVGVDDAEPRTQVSKVLATLAPAPDRYRILLYHRPDGARDAAAWGAHLMLCGHTHNGQIVPFNYLVRRVFPRVCGRYDVDGLHLYVTPGTGTWGPVLRLGSRSEISLIRLS